MAGYSGTPLIQKLGFKPGIAVTVINAPASYAKLLGQLPEGVRLEIALKRGCLFVHLFTRDRDELKKYLVRLRSNLADTGMVWISWPKKISGLETSVNENVIRDLALPLGFVDTKVCAVDSTWSGLKLMIRRADRKTAKK
ncbi:MAG TPA: DUF3052 family protein [Chthoniobacterales bacterium]|jgi:hypothetical protein